MIISEKLGRMAPRVQGAHAPPATRETPQSQAPVPMTELAASSLDTTRQAAETVVDTQWRTQRSVAGSVPASVTQDDVAGRTSAQNVSPQKHDVHGTPSVTVTETVSLGNPWQSFATGAGSQVVSRRHSSRRRERQDKKSSAGHDPVAQTEESETVTATQSSVRRVMTGDQNGEQQGKRDVRRVRGNDTSDRTTIEDSGGASGRVAEAGALADDVQGHDTTSAADGAGAAGGLPGSPRSGVAVNPPSPPSPRKPAAESGAAPPTAQKRRREEMEQESSVPSGSPAKPKSMGVANPVARVRARSRPRATSPEGSGAAVDVDDEDAADTQPAAAWSAVSEDGWMSSKPVGRITGEQGLGDAAPLMSSSKPPEVEAENQHEGAGDSDANDGAYYYEVFVRDRKYASMDDEAWIDTAVKREPVAAPVVEGEEAPRPAPVEFVPLIVDKEQRVKDGMSSYYRESRDGLSGSSSARGTNFKRFKRGARRRLHGYVGYIGGHSSDAAAPAAAAPAALQSSVADDGSERVDPPVAARDDSDVSVDEPPQAEPEPPADIFDFNMDAVPEVPSRAPRASRRRPGASQASASVSMPRRRRGRSLR